MTALGQTPLAGQIVVDDGIMTVNGTAERDVIRFDKITFANPNGGPRNPSVEYIRATLRDGSGALLAQKYVRSHSVDEVHAYGHDGDDTIINATNRRSRLFGGVGNDTIRGGSGSDAIFGGPQNDQLFGNNGDDEIFGESGIDQIFGGADNDLLDGGSHTDYIYGGDGDDRLQGGTGSDILYGEAGNDQIFGGIGNDVLHGGANNDGLFGGSGVDTLTGGTGADRFLVWYDQAGFWASTHNDTIVDLAAIDAEVQFINTDKSTRSNDYHKAAWSLSEIETLDTALEILMDRTGNTDLLKKSNGGVMKIKRFSEPRKPQEGMDIFASNDDDRIAVLDRMFVHDANVANYVLLHEIGHYWDEANEHSRVDAFRSLSGWQKASEAPDGFSESLAEGDRWIYETDASFVSEYAKWEPREDWAETFALNLVLGAGFSVNGTVWADVIGTDANKIAAADEKLDALDAFFEDFS